MTRVVWTKVFGLLALVTFVSGTGYFIYALATAPVEGDDLYAMAVPIAVGLIAIPTLLLTALFGLIYLLLSSSELDPKTAVIRGGLVGLAVFPMSAAIIEVFTNQVGPETPILLALAGAGLYFLWRDVRKKPQTPRATG